MSEEPQDYPKEAEDPAKALWGDKWFWPILDDLGKFQKAMKPIFPGAEEVLADDAPDWSLVSAMQCAQPMSDYTGFDIPPNWDVRHVGKMMGTEWSICDAYERSFPLWKALNPEQIREIDAAWYPGFCHDCTEITRKFAEKWAPQFREIRRKAKDVVLDKAGGDELEYYQGYAQGGQFMAQVWKNFKPPKHKRGKDAQVRNCVFFFAMCCGQIIEEEKSNLSWPELHELFLEFVDNKVDIEEDAFKKILSRSGLKGVGRPGRKVPDDIGTPKSRRRP